MLDGGINAWREAGLGIQVDRRQPLELMRQVQLVAGALILLGVLLGFTVAPAFFGLSAFVIARETDEEAQAVLRHLAALAEKDAAWRAEKKANTDPDSVMAKTIAKFPRVGSNGGTGAGLVGGYDTVASRIEDFNRAGIETFMLQFQPFEAEMRRFAEQIMPRVCRA